MELRRPAFIAVLLLALASSRAEGQLVNLGLFGGEVRDIAVRPEGASTELLIVTGGCDGIYRCGLNGWEPAFGCPCNATEIEADLTPGSAGTVWAIIDGRVRVHRPGQPWSESGWSTDNSVGRADALHGHASGMYIGGDGTVYRSTDADRTLAPLATFPGDRIQSIAVYKPTLFYVVSGTCLYQCQDDSNGFVATKLEAACDGAPITDVAMVAIDPADPRNASALNRFFIWSDGPSGGLFRTDDGGKTWTRLPVSTAPGRRPSIRFASFRDKRRVFFADRYSDNHGQSWNEMPETTVATTLGVVSGRAAGLATQDPNAPSLIYFATATGVGQWDMTANRATEVHNAAGIRGVTVFDIARVSDDPAARTLIWAATDRGLGKTQVYPAATDVSDWLFPVRPLDETVPLSTVALHPRDLEIVLAGDVAGTIYRTTTGGIDASCWAAVFSTRNSPFNTRYRVPEKTAITAIRIVDRESNIVYASTAATDNRFEGAVYRSLNNGTTWDDDFAAASGLNLNMPVNDLALLDQMVWAGVGHPDDQRTDAKGLYVRLSITGAANWWKMPTGTGLDGEAVLAVKGASIGGLRVLYAATNQGVYCGRLDSSTGSQWTWRTISPNGRRRYVALAVEPDQPNHVCVAHDNAIWASSDGGVNWGLIPPSATGEFDRVLSLLYRDLLVGTSCGLLTAPEDAFDPEGRIRVPPSPRVPASQPSAVVTGEPRNAPSAGQDLLPFKIPPLLGLGLTDTVGLWLPLLMWLAIARHNRSR